jgi:DNA mismatch repair ATPase MutS
MLRQNFGQIKENNYDFDLIRRYNHKKDNSQSYQQLSEQTKTDLDLDLFFEHINRTSSPIGEQVLYNRISNIIEDPNIHEKQEKLNSYFHKNPEERLKVQYELSKLDQHDSYYISDLFQDDLIENPKWYFLIPILSFTSLLSIFLGFFNPIIFGVFLVLLPINVIIHFKNKSSVNLYIRAVPQLLAMNKVAKNILHNPLLNTLYVDKKNSIDRINQVKKRVGIFKLEQKVDTDLEITYWFILEVIKITFLLEPLLLYNVVNKMNKEQGAIEEVYSMIGEIDTTISILSLRSSSEEYCLPTILQENAPMSFNNLRHPLIEKCIPNSFIGNSKHYLITGSNMSGKSTFMRAIGLNCLSALTLNTCFAHSFSLPLLKIHSVMRITDSLQDSTSYFLKEVTSIKKILDESENEQINLILIDEIFKGTNTLERIAAAKSILSYLSKVNNLVVASSHDLELTELLENQYTLNYFSENVQNNTIHFDYKLKKGKPSIGNALRILKINDYPLSIIK